MTSERNLTIDVIPTPKKAITVVTGIIALVFLGFLWLMASKAPEEFWGVFALAVLTTVGTPFLINLLFVMERKRGPVLTHCVDDGFVCLPRQGRRISISEIDSFAVVTTHDGGDWQSQLQLCLKSAERLLLVTAYTKKQLRPVIGKIQARIKAPVVFLKQKSRDELCEEK